MIFLILLEWDYVNSFTKWCVMHGMLIYWTFRKTGIYITGVNIAGPAYIITHTEVYK